MAGPDHHRHAPHAHGPIEFHFCPRCGGNLSRRRIKAIEPERLVCEQCAYVFYQDPKVVAATIFTVQGSIVLLRRAVEPALGRWVFPGGYVDRGESVADAAVRETKEESNLDVRLSALLNVYSYTGSPNVVVVYAAEVVGGALQACDESDDARLFLPGAIPWQDLAFQSTEEALKDYLKLYLNAQT
jgi:ADP-ribose pyrophosphatase YjhB (NUDIX family)